MEISSREIVSRESRWVKLAAPVNVVPQDQVIFEPGHQYELPDQRIDVLGGVQAFGRGPLRHQGHFLAESFVAPEQLDTWKRKHGPLRLRLEQLISSAGVIEEPVVWITDNWSCGYFHWFCDALPRLELALKHYRAEELTLVLPHKFRRASYFRESLDAYPLRSVRFLKRFESVMCREMVLPNHIITTGNHDPDLADAIRGRFHRLLGCGAPPTKRVYISRERASRRKVENESEVTEVLSTHGFQKIIAEEMSWRDQVQLMSESQFLVSNHGSGLTNMLAMQPGAGMLEIRDRENTFQNCFWSLANATGIDYHYLLADKSNAKQSSHLSNVRVDCQQLTATVDKILTKRLAA